MKIPNIPNFVVRLPEVPAALRPQLVTIHLAARHPTTGEIGCYHTPLPLLATVCRAGWPEDERPKRTILWTLVTCAECLRRISVGSA